MKNILVAMAVIVLLLSVGTGCDRLGGSKAGNSPVIAKIDKDTITADDFTKEIGRVPEWARNQFSDEEGKKKFLDELIKRDLVYHDALKMKLNNDPEYLSKVEEFKKMTLVSLILKKEVEEKAAVSDEDVKAFFDQNEDKFTIGTEIRASHILVDTEEKAKKIHERINKGENFADLARSQSMDKGSAEKGGDLGYFGRGKMVPEFENAALSLKPGEVSGPVQTRFGYHIIKLTDVKKGTPANFEQSKEAIRRQLISDKRKQLFDSYIEKLNKEIKVVKNEENLSKIALPWGQSEEPSPHTQQE